MRISGAAKRFGLFVFLNLAVLPLWPQAGQTSVDPSSYIGLTLADLYGRFGIPGSVYAARGLEVWQDDVVFVYGFADFFIVQDRVWKVGVKEAYLIRAGDPATAVFLSFGEAVSRGPEYAVFPFTGRPWPMSLRFNFDSSGRVSMIYIYRSDL